MVMTKHEIPDEQEFLSAKDLSKMFGVHDRTVREWFARGEIPSFKIGSTRRVRRSDLDAVIKERQQASK